jgi:hypothetical protein
VREESARYLIEDEDEEEDEDEMNCVRTPD